MPIYGRAESLNLATAAAVCLYASAGVQRGTVYRGIAQQVNRGPAVLFRHYMITFRRVLSWSRQCWQHWV